MIQADTERSGSSEQSTDQTDIREHLKLILEALRSQVNWMTARDLAILANNPQTSALTNILRALEIVNTLLAPSNVDRSDEAKSDAGRLNQLHSIRDTTIEDCARVADHYGQLSDGFTEEVICAESIAQRIRALKDKNPREE